MSSPGSAGGTGLPADSTHGCGDFCSHTSGTEGWSIGFGVSHHFYTMYISLELRRENRPPGGSLLTVVAILVRIQMERKGGNLIVAFC